MSRGEFKLNKNSYEYARGERVDWLDAFAENYAEATKIAPDKTAVQVARERQQSTYDQISSIVGNTFQHATVESKVQEMQERTGLTAYLQSMASMTPEEGAQKILDVFAQFGPKMQEDLMNFCKNKIAAHRGQISIPAIQHDLLATFRQHGIQPQDVNNEDVARCISGLIVDELKMNPPTDVSSTELGKVDNLEEDDNESADFFKGLQQQGG